MADNIDPTALGEVLSKARLSLDEVVSNLRTAGVISDTAAATRLRAADDNNSSCNTACSCGAAPAAEAIR